MSAKQKGSGNGPFGDLKDGSGCTEIWEQLSEMRKSEEDDKDNGRGQD